MSAQHYFLRAAQARNPHTEPDYISGAKVFKRQALGLCGVDATKSLDQLARVLHKIGSVDSLDEGRVAIPVMVGDHVYRRNASAITGNMDDIISIRPSDSPDKYSVYINTNIV